MDPKHLAHALLQWYEVNGRDLPWRHTRDPYAIWLSEVILQQTRIAQGSAYWHRFMERWPTVEQLAAASEDEVLKLWQGLGYYSRARNLHAAAQQVVALGGFPDTVEGIKRLKGVGDYTAAAIASLAFGREAAAVDGNVYRVLSRVYGIQTPINSTEGKKEFQLLADLMAQGHDAGRLNQAIMDFGALQCTPKSPLCVVCPLAENCEALRQGLTATLPVKTKTTKVVTRHLTYVYLRSGGHVALHQRGAGDIWQGLWEPLLLEPSQSSGLTLPPCAVPLAQGVKHVLTHRILLADFFLADCPERPPLPPDYRWVSLSQLDDYAVPRLVELLFEAVGKHDGETKITS
jgi:A/G-specific adenine glycosylase